MAPSQLQAAPTPRRCDGSKDKETKQTSVLDIAIWDDMAVIFYCLKSLPESLQEKSQNSQRKSQIVQAQCQQVRTHAMM